jgi:dienelactone hydrolase
MRLSFVLAAMLVAAACTRAAPGPKIETREFDYQGPSGEPLQGFVAWDDAAQGKRPGVLVVHEWWGHEQHTRNQARRLAEAGYVGLALDVYGKGKHATHPQDAQALVGEAMKDPTVVAARFNAAWQELKRDPHVDSTKIAAIGYCFGGMVVLNMARSGADLDAVASFHGALPEGPVDSGKVRARVLVLSGDADSFVPAAKVEAFRQAMEKAGARIAVVTYPGAKHGFTNPDAGSHGMDQLAYDAQVDSASWSAMRQMLKEVWP